ncbi:hypothetical protein [Peribacillus asahii]|uniref:Uncharacterized protein n=1 Tax=Peribacillus asahii TaxID=228899 RepID=A0A3Q9RKK7_9BACI|nr:hypothetical protein [Peribacillus asahii]AZV41348.1 hypothetical protein BAOM_0716 [Peribacillus asahii]USK85757.1 hypothetical protein LIT35_03575 [Peribacillus asahii]
MLILDELYNTVVFEVSSDELIRILKEVKNKKEIDIDLLKYKIHMFEKKKRIEEAYYQSLSTFRKIFTGRPPGHHQAVEYLVNVKERFNEIEMIKQNIITLNSILSLLEAEPNKQEIVLSPSLIEEIRKWQETEGN